MSASAHESTNEKILSFDNLFIYFYNCYFSLRLACIRKDRRDTTRRLLTQHEMTNGGLKEYLLFASMI